MMIDTVTVTLHAGRGGDGASTFNRNRYTDKAAPNGGDGGNGGNIYFVGSTNVMDLRQFQFQKHVTAADGTDGKRNNSFGKNAAHTTVLVPIGTRITDTATGESWEITDTKTPVLIAAGSYGGRGNYSFRTRADPLPESGQPGNEGQRRTVLLEMRLIAEIGLIGLPNAGKSSLLSVLTHAKPAIADYPFTTLEPNIGMMGNHPIADIPGLIEGASRGRGLGITFLKHIEKTTLLVHCLDVSLENLSEAYETVRTELMQYSRVLAEKQEIILLNKTDLVDQKRIADYTAFFKKKKKTVLTNSIYDPSGIVKLKKTLEKYLQRPKGQLIDDRPQM